jgi:hypothetical protein
MFPTASQHVGIRDTNHNKPALGWAVDLDKNSLVAQQGTQVIQVLSHVRPVTLYSFESVSLRSLR